MSSATNITSSTNAYIMSQIEEFENDDDDEFYKLADGIPDYPSLDERLIKFPIILNVETNFADKQIVYFDIETTGLGKHIKALCIIMVILVILYLLFVFLLIKKIHLPFGIDTFFLYPLKHADEMIYTFWKHV